MLKRNRRAELNESTEVEKAAALGLTLKEYREQKGKDTAKLIQQGKDLVAKMKAYEASREHCSKCSTQLATSKSERYKICKMCCTHESPSFTRYGHHEILVLCETCNCIMHLQDLIRDYKIVKKEPS